MTPRKHARLAHQLIAACGGLDEAAGACRVGKSTLSTYQNPQETATMPADVMADLEAYCGEPIYSREIAAARPWQPTVASTLKETHDVVRVAADLAPLALAVENGEPGAVERFEAALDDLKREAAEARAAAAGKVVKLAEVR